jgi:hypothetical protein
LVTFPAIVPSQKASDRAERSCYWGEENIEPACWR